PARRRARPGQPAVRLPVPPALPDRQGQLPRAGPAAGPGGRARDRLPGPGRSGRSRALMWYVNANVIDVLAGERLRQRAVETAPDGTVTRIAAAAPSWLPDEVVVDVAGRWLLPGLISCHTHLSIVFGEVDEAENPALTAYRAATRATEALYAGVTTVRCVHEQNRADLLLRTTIRRGWYQAPRIFG